jgi:hypothetical protein
VLSAAQVNALLDGSRDDALGALWACWLRRGSGWAKPSGSNGGDLDRAQLRVQRSLVPPTHEVTWLVEEPKTDNSRRVVHRLSRTVDALKWHRT